MYTFYLLIIANLLPPDKKLTSFCWRPQVIGATWYLASIGRQHSCWKQQCDVEERGGLSCKYMFLDCSSLGLSDREDWLIVTEILTKCDARKDDSDFKFGMFADAFTSQVASSVFTDKYLYCLWWGLRNLRFDLWDSKCFCILHFYSNPTHVIFLSYLIRCYLQFMVV